MGDDRGYLGYNSENDYNGDHRAGSLTDDDFTWNGTDYTVESLLYNPVQRVLSIDFSTGTLGENDGITLHLGDLELHVADAGRRYARNPGWLTSEISWTIADTVDVEITYQADE